MEGGLSIKTLRLLFITGVIGVILLSGCGTETQTSIKDISEEGWAAHNVKFEVARVSDIYGGGISYSEDTNQYAFGIYDKSTEIESNDMHDHIVVIVKSEKIDFDPEGGEFIEIEGELQASDDDTIISDQEGWRYTDAEGEGLIIYATNVTETDPPADW